MRLVPSGPARPVNRRRRWCRLAATLLAAGLASAAGAIAGDSPGPVDVAQATGTPTERPITMGDASLLVPGASVVVRAQRTANGTVSASRLTVGVNGTWLPM
jgi:ferric-dicitrate binding protein FerR (iron transport regulator)